MKNKKIIKVALYIDDRAAFLAQIKKIVSYLNWLEKQREPIVLYIPLFLSKKDDIIFRLLKYLSYKYCVVAPLKPYSFNYKILIKKAICCKIVNRFFWINRKSFLFNRIDRDYQMYRVYKELSFLADEMLMISSKRKIKKTHLASFQDVFFMNIKNKTKMKFFIRR